MKRSIAWLATALLLIPMMGAPQPQPPGGGQEQKPTLGPPPGSSTRAPRTATVNDYQKLTRIRKLYVERMDNALNDKLIVTLGKLGRFKIVASPKEADALVTGSCLESRRLKRLHSEVFISDQGGASIWQDNVFRPFNPPSLEQAVNETARVVAEHLGQSLSEAAAK